LERGILFNKQVIKPGEAVNLWTPSYGPKVLPFSIVALVGDENSIPTSIDSLRNFVGMSAVPVAFIGGTVLSVATMGALAAPAAGLTGSAAVLAPLIGKGVTLAGYTIAAGNLAAGAASAVGAEVVAQQILDDHPAAFMTKVRNIMPGTKYFAVKGGPQADGVVTPLKIEEIDMVKYRALNISTVKNCISVKGRYNIKKVAFKIDSCGDGRAEGDWTQYGIARGRPKYHHVEDKELKIKWSKKNKMWRMYYGEGWRKSILYKAAENLGEVPLSGWEAVNAGLPLPALHKVSENETEGVMTTPETEDDVDEDADSDSESEEDDSDSE